MVAGMARFLLVWFLCVGAYATEPSCGSDTTGTCADTTGLLQSKAQVSVHNNDEDIQADEANSNVAQVDEGSRRRRQEGPFYTASLQREGYGFCEHGGSVYQSRAYELTGGWSPHGAQGFFTPEYSSWVEEAWKRCLKHDVAVNFVSVWRDAGYRCYTGHHCGSKKPHNACASDLCEVQKNAITYKPKPAPLAYVGWGFCSGDAIYQSVAWELTGGVASGVKGFDTAEYKEWRDDAWKRCRFKDARVNYVSVWKDAGYRCYATGKGLCKPQGSHDVKSWRGGKRR